MYNGLLHLHNVMRWVILLLLLIAMFQSFSRSGSVRQTSLWLLISAHITFLLGVYQWFAGELGWKMIQNTGISQVMKAAGPRFFAIEHPIGMLFGIILITVARGKVKEGRLSSASWIYLIALVIILLVVPWPFREGVGRPWFPGVK